MKIYREVAKKEEFKFWGGAIDVVKALSEEEFQFYWEMFEDSCDSNGASETEVNDYFWFDVPENYEEDFGKELF